MLADELKHAISVKATSLTKVGNRTKKGKEGRTSTPPAAPFTVQPSDIMLAEGAFVDGEQKALNQVALPTIGPFAQGVIIATRQEALPYLSSQQKQISADAPGLLVIDCFDSEAGQHKGQVIRLPAWCKSTKEPLLFNAALFQLGANTCPGNHAN